MKTLINLLNEHFRVHVSLDVDNKLIVNDVDSYGNSWKKDPKFKISSSRFLENLHNVKIKIIYILQYKIISCLFFFLLRYLR